MKNFYENSFVKVVRYYKLAQKFVQCFSAWKEEKTTLLNLWEVLEFATFPIANFFYS